MVEVDPWVLAGLAAAIIIPIGLAIAFFVKLNTKVEHLENDHKKEIDHLKEQTNTKVNHLEKEVERLERLLEKQSELAIFKLFGGMDNLNEFIDYMQKRNKGGSISNG